MIEFVTESEMNSPKNIPTSGSMSLFLLHQVSKTVATSRGNRFRFSKSSVTSNIHLKFFLQSLPNGARWN